MMDNLKQFYRKRFTNKIFVLKAGGRIITDDAARMNLLRTIKKLNRDNIKVLLIYGGGQAIDEAIAAEDRKPLKIDGRRITSAEDIATVKKVLTGDLGMRLSESMAELGLDGYCLNALPPNWGKVKRRPKQDGITRYDGTLESIDAKTIKGFFAGTQLVVCPCLGLLDNGDTININADNAAVALSAGCRCAKLVFLSDVDGISVNGQIASVLRARDLSALIADGTITGGMQVKAENCIEALQAGVKRVHILNGFRKDALLKEVYTPDGDGTMIVRYDEKKKYETNELSALAKMRTALCL